MPIESWALGIGLAGNLHGPRRDPDLLFLGEPENLLRGGTVNHLPERNAAPVAVNHLADEIGHEPADGLLVSLPEPDPVWQGGRAELDQRAPPPFPAPCAGTRQAGRRAGPSGIFPPMGRSASRRRRSGRH